MRKFTKISKKNQNRVKIISFIFVISVIPTFTLIIRENNFYGDSIYNERKISLKDHLNIAMSYVENVYEQFISGEISNLSEAQSLALSRLKSLRYGPGNLDYFWVQDFRNGSPHLIMHPYFEDTENIEISNLTQQVITLVYQEVQEDDEDPNEGFVEYNWPYYNDSSLLVPKLSFVKEFEPWDWIIGSGVYVNDINEVLREKLNQNIITIVGIYGLFTLLYIGAMMYSIRKQSLTKQELEMSESKYRTIVTQMNEGLIQIDPNGLIIYINNRMQKMLGFSSKEVLGQDLSGLLSKESQKKFEEEFSQRASGYKARYELDWIAKNGTKIKTLIAPTPLFDSNNNFIGSFGLITDISQIKKIQDDLYEKQSLLETTLGNIKDGVILTNKSGKIVIFNESAEKISEWNAAKAMGHNLSEILHIYESDIDKSKIDPLLINSSLNVNLKTKSNQNKIVSLHSTPIYSLDKVVKGILVIFRDITVSKKLEEDMINTQKIESIQLLAAGIAHDFNNFLTTIIGNLSYIKFNLRKNDPDMIEMLNDAENASMQAKNLSNQLLSFSIDKKEPLVSLNLAELIKNTAKFSLSGKNVKSEIKIDSKLYNVDGISGQLQRVFQNLIVNAVQAMENHGEIKIKAKNILINPPSPFHLNAGPYVEIEIIDNGKGIPKEGLNKIFEPFYTTKKKGHGLGLAMCYSIIQNHNGYIYAESTVGKGSNFHILLPKSHFEKNQEEKSSSLIETSRSGNILVLEDNPTIQTTFSRILKYLGYQSQIFNKGEDLIQKYQVLLREKSSPLVILDLTVPGGMGGKETIKRLLKIDPTIKAIVTSGFSTDPVIMHYIDYGFSSILLKPFTLEDVADALKMVQ